MGVKPTDLSDHVERLHDGRSRRVEHAVHIFRDVESGDCYGLTEDGHLVTGYLMTLLGDDPATVLHQSEAAKLLREARKGALGLLAIVSSPVASAIADLLGMDLDHAKALLGALSERSDVEKVGALVDLYGSEKLRAWKQLARRKLADGELSPEEAAELLRYWD